MKKTNTTAEATPEAAVAVEEKPVVEETTSATSASAVEVNEHTLFDLIGKSPLNPKDPNDGWSYYWGNADDDTGSIGRLKMRGYEVVRVGSDAEIPTYGGQRRPDGTIVYGNLVLMKRPKEASDKELEAKRRQYKRLANQKVEEAEEEMRREGAEHQPNRRTFYFAENPLSK